MIFAGPDCVNVHHLRRNSRKSFSNNQITQDTAINAADIASMYGQMRAERTIPPVSPASQKVSLSHGDERHNATPMAK